MPPTNAIFSTRYNFLKIYDNNSGTFGVPNTPGSTPTTVLLTTHGLGYIPRIKVWYVPVSGQLWPLVRDQYDKSGGGTGTILSLIGGARADTTILYADMFNLTGSTQNIVFYWRIYLDE